MKVDKCGSKTHGVFETESIMYVEVVVVLVESYLYLVVCQLKMMPKGRPGKTYFKQIANALKCNFKSDN